MFQLPTTLRPCGIRTHNHQYVTDVMTSGTSQQINPSTSLTFKPFLLKPATVLFNKFFKKCTRGILQLICRACSDPSHRVAGAATAEAGPTDAETELKRTNLVRWCNNRHNSDVSRAFGPTLNQLLVPFFAKCVSRHKKIVGVLTDQDLSLIPSIKSCSYIMNLSVR